MKKICNLAGISNTLKTPIALEVVNLQVKVYMLIWVQLRACEDFVHLDHGKIQGMHEIIMELWGTPSVRQPAGMSISLQTILSRRGGLKKFLGMGIETIFDKTYGGNGELSHLLLYSFWSNRRSFLENRKIPRNSTRYDKYFMPCEAGRNAVISYVAMC